MPIKALLLAVFIATTCGGYTYIKTAHSVRNIASLTVEDLLKEEEKTFGDELDEKLNSLNSYYLIAQKNMTLFDESVMDKTLEQLYQSTPYLNILAVKTQVTSIEQDLIALYESAQKNAPNKFKLLQEKINSFSMASDLQALAMSNLRHQLNMPVLYEGGADPKKIEKEYQEVETTKEFQIYESNIEHISHLIGMNTRSRNIRPSSSTEGSITGEDLPTKVWAITFENGPNQRNTSEILRQLKNKKIKATFFQTALKSQKMIKSAEEILQQGMEIASNSQSYKNLMRRGARTLDEEITSSTKSIEDLLKIDIKFYRLPFGIGTNTPEIRERIARNNLIHVGWNIDSLDWMAQDPAKIVKRTKTLMKKTSRDSGIILFHDVHHRTITASAAIMDYLKMESRRSCTIGKIVNEINQGMSSVCLTN